MKFLEHIRPDQQIVPLRMMYTDISPTEDVLAVVYKDVRTGNHYVENIKNPMIEIYVTRPEYRNKEVSESFMHDVHKIEYCDKHTVRYKYRMFAAAKILGCSKEEVLTNPYVANLDVDIENWYFIQFLREYPYDGIVETRVGYFDIETDITKVSVIGESPIVCITYISETANTVFNLSVRNDKYKRWDEFEACYNTGFVEDCQESFQLYNKYSPEQIWEYVPVIYNTEAEMLIAFWKLVKVLNDDFLVAWNAPFDVNSIINRMSNIGIDPIAYVCDDKFAVKKIDIEEDTQIMVTKRRHKFDITIIPTVACLMTMYANVNSSGPRIPSFKLNVIADKVLEDKKVDYQEFGNIMDFLYSDFYLFNKYNIKDVWLMVGINHKEHITDDAYSRMLSYGIQFPAVFSSNNMLPSVLMIEMWDMGLIPGVNRNRNNIPKEIHTFSFDDDMDEDEIESNMSIINASTKLAEGEKFVGAIVQDPRRMTSTGYMINGAPAKYVHRFGIDMDITSEYPTAMCLMNMSNDTLVGKIIPSDANDIELPMYDAYYMYNGEESEYTCNKMAVLAETLSQRDFILAGKIGFGLPDTFELDKLLSEE